MLAPGTRLGAYEVVSLVGAGGMGEVYKARDTRLGRSVALKVLHADVAGDPRRRERFEREARAVSSLNHPRICTLYDVSHHQGVEFLVMEFVGGETLADRLAKGPVPIDMAVRYAIEIAEALDHAHRRGITHRDLKPPNVMLTAGGVKLLDFGVAKLRDGATAATRSLDRAVEVFDTSHATRVVPLTDEGTLLGTFEYMAPEQLQGQDADERADVFALGAVLYEMLAGRRAFSATTPAAVIGAVMMAQPPPLRDIRPVSPLLDRIIAQCLAKNPDDRWQHVRDVRAALQWVLDGIDSAAPSAISSRRRQWSTLAAAGVLAALIVGLTIWRLSTTTSSAGTLGRWDVAAPMNASFAAEVFPSVAVSPDGRHVAFRVQSGASSQLYLRESDDFEGKPIQGSEGAHTPFFSPDGQWIGFLSNGRIFKAPVAGGPPILVASAPSLSPTSPGATWGADGTIVFAAGAAGLMRIAEAGGTPEVLTTPDASRGEVTHISPQFIGDGQVLFSIRTNTDQWRVGVLSRATGKWDWFPPLGRIAGATYVEETGHLIYAQAGKLYAVPIDLSRRTFTGAPMPLPEAVYTHVIGGSMVAQFAASRNGVLAFMSGEPSEWTLVRVDRQRNERRISDEAHAFRYPRFSPDGHLVAVTIEEERSDVYLVDADRGTVRKLTKDGGTTTPSWTRNGRSVVFSWLQPGSDSYDVYSIPIDESAPPALLFTRPGGQFVSGSTPKGDVLTFYELTNKTARDIWTWSLAGETATVITATQANERSASFSPDGGWLAFVSNESERDRVYVQRYPGPGGREVVSPPGGTEPVWSPTTRELFYRLGNRIMAVSFDPDSGHVGAPTVTLEGPYVPAPAETGRPNYDVSRDGSFVLVRTVERSATHLHVVQQWFNELRAQ